MVFAEFGESAYLTASTAEQRDLLTTYLRGDFSFRDVKISPFSKCRYPVYFALAMQTSPPHPAHLAAHGPHGPLVSAIRKRSELDWEAARATVRAKVAGPLPPARHAPHEDPITTRFTNRPAEKKSKELIETNTRWFVSDVLIRGLLAYLRHVIIVATSYTIVQ